MKLLFSDMWRLLHLRQAYSPAASPTGAFNQLNPEQDLFTFRAGPDPGVNVVCDLECLDFSWLCTVPASVLDVEMLMLDGLSWWCV